jgi:DNA invertase Pin-like site-specific DNA recombinase
MYTLANHFNPRVNTFVLAKNYAYIRISDKHKQSARGQRDSIQRYSDNLGLVIDDWLEISLSGSKTSKEARGLIGIIEKMTPGDRLLVNDIERLGRDSVSDILEVITRILNVGAEIHFCLSKEVITPEHKNDMSMLFIQIGRAFAAQDFSKQRSEKAKAAAARRQRKGLPAGRAKGAIVRSRLDIFENQIIYWLTNGMSKAQASRNLCTPTATMHKWLDRRDELICLARDLKVWEPGMNIVEVKKAFKKVTKEQNDNM